MNPVDAFLSTITMYRLVLYYLLVLLTIGFVGSFFGLFPFTPLNLIFSGALILAIGWMTHTLFAKVFNAMPSVEAVYITCLILTLIITPVAPTDATGVAFLIFATVWAMASKYIFAIGKKHVFNPAAFGIALATLLIGGSASWWVGGNLPLMAFVVIGGLLIVRKLKRFDLVLAFVVMALLTVSLTTPNTDFFTPMKQALLHTPIFFLAFVMLTEPATTPATRVKRFMYGALVGFLFAPTIHLGSLYLTPELALLLGNVFVYVVSAKGRLVLTLLEKRLLATDTFEFIFAPDRALAFEAGQYLEWTLPHAKTDARGNRRYFTIASAPSEDTLRLGVKFTNPSSSFKQALQSLPLHASLSAAQLAGDFTLPKDSKKKLAFIAGGIGITPFRSQIQHLLDTNEARDIVLLYGAKRATDLAYQDVFTRAAETLGMKTVYALSEEPDVADTYSGMIDRALLEKEVPDYLERRFYLSGPNAMVEAFKKTLREMGVRRTHITTDYFPGFA